MLSQRLRELSFLNAGLRIVISDERTDKSHDFCYEGGIVSFVEHLNRTRAAAPPPAHLRVRRADLPGKGGEDVRSRSRSRSSTTSRTTRTSTPSPTTSTRSRAAATWSVSARRSRVRSIATSRSRGRTARRRARRSPATTPARGLTAVISVKLPQPEFEGQTKTKLGTSEVRGLVEDWSTTSSRLPRGEPVGGEAAAGEGAGRRARPEGGAQGPRPGAPQGRPLRSQPPGQARRLPGDAIPPRRSSSSSRATRRAARRSRVAHAETQAILPIRGKILNVERARLDKMLSSAEIQALVTAIGCGIGPDFDIEKARYHKIIIMTDADVDGSHIRTLLLTFFYRQMRDLIERGYLYIAQPPLFKVKKGKGERYIKDERALEEHLLDLALSGAEVTASGRQRADRDRRLARAAARRQPVQAIARADGPAPVRRARHRRLHLGRHAARVRPGTRRGAHATASARRSRRASRSTRPRASRSPGRRRTIPSTAASASWPRRAAPASSS